MKENQVPTDEANDKILPLVMLYYLIQHITNDAKLSWEKLFDNSTEINDNKIMSLIFRLKESCSCKIRPNQKLYRARAYKNSEIKEIYKKSRSEGFGAEVKRRIILGTYVLSSGYYDAYYKKAQQVRTLVKKEFAKAFEKYDVILTPTSPTVAFEIGSKSNNPLEMYLADIYTVPVNVAGLPGISIPCGVDSKGMPIGMQLIGNRFAEGTILNAAYTYEQATKFRENFKPNF